jgi:hypothetical protein
MRKLAVSVILLLFPHVWDLSEKFEKLVRTASLVRHLRSVSTKREQMHRTRSPRAVQEVTNFLDSPELDRQSLSPKN